MNPSVPPHKRGRPPSTQLAVLRVLEKHPEFRNSPKKIRRLLSNDPAFADITAKALSQAKSRLQSKLGGYSNISKVCNDCLENGRLSLIVAASDNELVCGRCGKSFDYLPAEYSTAHSEIVNRIWKAYDSRQTNGQMIPALHETRRIVSFGNGRKSKLEERALCACTEMLKSYHYLPIKLTNRIAFFLEKQCKIRSNEIKRVAHTDVKDVVILAFLDFAKENPIYQNTMMNLIEESSIYFPDVAASSKIPKSTKLNLIDLQELD